MPVILTYVQGAEPKEMSGLFDNVNQSWLDKACCGWERIAEAKLQMKNEVIEEL